MRLWLVCGIFCTFCFGFFCWHSAIFLFVQCINCTAEVIYKTLFSFSLCPFFFEIENELLFFLLFLKAVAITYTHTHYSNNCLGCWLLFFPPPDWKVSVTHTFMLWHVYLFIRVEKCPGLPPIKTCNESCLCTDFFFFFFLNQVIPCTGINSFWFWYLQNHKTRFTLNAGKTHFPPAPGLLSPFSSGRWKIDIFSRVLLGWKQSIELGLAAPVRCDLCVLSSGDRYCDIGLTT